MIYVVLGMHKSGTSLVAQTLHESGIRMGAFDDRLDYERGHKYEHREFQQINRELLAPFLVPDLAELRARRRRAGALDEAGFPRNGDSRAWVREGRLHAHLESALPAERARMRALVGRCEAAATGGASSPADWGFKDPRTTLTYALWRSLLPEHRVIAVFRGLGEVVQHYGVGASQPLRLLRVARAWSLYNRVLLEHLRAVPKADALVLRYEDVMSAEGCEELARLSAFVGREVCDARDHALYRNRGNANRAAEASSLPRWLRTALSTPPLRLDPVGIERDFERLAA